ncbi:colanic acid biosynthesis glycosyl transferase WcaI [Pelomonas aquatica]|uniref:Colanic acid biosynthesis glycosyl transferase WcaI n=1 Tax=Pelomonas aquatica TaxID=431058 RepID=A0ABU1Z547_9BURK|nr:glycosyltransferase WbuB [Pelomonas aquatica]MDR7295727.1 colanic acid biosynthesis glycosyl transferase WcaI [Pelomonas aquatica]
MKLLIYGINFAPELTGIGKYSGEMVQWLSDRGHAVEVVTAPPYYPAWQRADGYPAWGYRHENWGQGGTVRVTRCPLWVPARPSGLKRLIHLASFALSSAPALWRVLRDIKRRPDAVVLVVPTLFTAPAALWLGRRYGVPVWLHVQDFEVDAMLGMGIVVGGGGLANLAYRFERWCLRSAAVASSITGKMVDRLLAKGVDPKCAQLFPNWVDLSSVYPLPRPNAFRAELGLAESDVLVLYSGNMGEKQGLELVIEAARRLQSVPGLRFVLAGDGGARPRLMAQAQGLANLQWLPLQPSERLNLMLNAADIHVLPQRADAADLVMPSKLTGMLASGRAVVGTAAADTQLGAVLSQCGVRIEPGDAAALADTLQVLARQPERRDALGAAGRAYAKAELAQDAILLKFESAVRALASR